MARAALLAGAMLTATLGIATPAQASVPQHQCSPVHANGFSICIDNSTYYPYIDRTTHITVSMHGTHDTDYRVTLGGAHWTDLMRPGQSRTLIFSGRVSTDACVQEATLGRICTHDAVVPYTSTAG